MPQEPLITWNLLVSNLVIPLCLLILWGGIKRQFVQKDAKDKQIEELKDAAIKEWRLKFDTTLCSVKGTVDEIKEDMHRKVPFPYCEDREREIRGILHDHDRRIREVGG